MKKILAFAVAISLASTAMAGGVAFDFGTNFFKPSANGAQAQNGQNFLMSWTLEGDLSFGVYTEQSNLFGIANWPVGTTFTVSAIQVAKGVLKNVQVGLNLGSGTDSAAAPSGSTAPLCDVFGTVTMLSGAGEKVTGALRATVSARFCNTTNNTDGVNVGLSVQVAF
jgi:hypothetical protein